MPQLLLCHLLLTPLFLAILRRPPAAPFAICVETAVSEKRKTTTAVCVVYWECPFSHEKEQIHIHVLHCAVKLGNFYIVNYCG